MKEGARSKAEREAAELLQVDPEYRREFMEHLIKQLGEHVCTDCWIRDPGCQCSNDD